MLQQKQVESNSIVSLLSILSFSLYYCYYYYYITDRYEDLASDPTIVATDLMKWLRIPWLELTSKFIKLHTRRNDRRSSSTYRVLGSRIAAWRSMDWRVISQVQSACNQTMATFNYTVVGELTSNSNSDDDDDDEPTFGYYPLHFRSAQRQT